MRYTLNTLGLSRSLSLPSWPDLYPPQCSRDPVLCRSRSESKLMRCRKWAGHFPVSGRVSIGTADRWARSARWLKREDKKYGEELAKMAKMYSSETFDACNDPLEAVVFSALVGILKRQDELEEEMKKIEDH